MNILDAFVNAIHILICLSLVGIVLIQQGKGADTGAVFGGGSNTLFGASGADTLLTKITTFLAIGFFATSIFLAYSARHPVVQSSSGDEGLFGDTPVKEAPMNLPTSPAETPQEQPQAASPTAAPSDAPQNSEAANANQKPSAPPKPWCWNW